LHPSCPRGAVVAIKEAHLFAYHTRFRVNLRYDCHQSPLSVDFICPAILGSQVRIGWLANIVKILKVEMVWLECHIGSLAASQVPVRSDKSRRVDRRQEQCGKNDLETEDEEKRICIKVGGRE